MEKKIAVVTGANKGLGFATAQALAQQNFTVIMVGRNQEKIELAANQLLSNKLEVVPFVMNVTDKIALLGLEQYLSKNFGHLDVLINNAGILLEKLNGSFEKNSNILEADLDIIRQTFETNTLAPLQFCQLLMPLLNKSKMGRIVNISSQLGSLEMMSAGWPAYRLSKTGLNCITRILHAQLQSQNSPIKVNSVSPGWVKTDMGTQDAPRTLEEGIRGILWAATLPEDGPSGGFFEDGKPIAW